MASAATRLRLPAAIAGALLTVGLLGMIAAEAQVGTARKPVPGYGSSQPVPTKRYLNPGPVAPRPAEIENPYLGQPDAIDEGHRLFADFHCAECHGPGAGGFIGPSLRDPYWRYGGDPASIFESIWAGRPHGMPTWAGKIEDDQIWKLVAFIQALQDTSPDALQPGSGWE